MECCDNHHVRAVRKSRAGAEANLAQVSVTNVTHSKMCEYYDFHVWKGADNTMKPEAITPAKHIAIQQVGIDSLFKEMAEWSNRIAKRAYEFFVNSGYTNGHDLDDWFKAEKELLKPVALELKDSKDEFVVTAEVPGVDVKTLTSTSTAHDW